MKYLNVAMILAAVTAAQPALADSSASANTSTGSESSFLNAIKSNLKASYLFEMTGGTLGAPSGNVDGSGKNLSLGHYPALGAKLGGKWSFTVTQPILQTLDNKPEGAKGTTPAVTFGDTYVSFNNTRIMGGSWNSFNLFGQLRFYAPTSRATHDAYNKHAASEAANGRLRFLLDPSFAFMDGALSLDFPTYFFYRMSRSSDAERIAANGSQYRNDFRLLPSAVVAYQATKNVQPYVETGVYINHMSNGEWTTNAKDAYGHYIAQGTNINIGKKLILTPILQFGPYYFSPKHAQITLDATYIFL